MTPANAVACDVSFLSRLFRCGGGGTENALSVTLQGEGRFLEGYSTKRNTVYFCAFCVFNRPPVSVAGHEVSRHFVSQKGPEHLHARECIRNHFEQRTPASGAAGSYDDISRAIQLAGIA